MSIQTDCVIIGAGPVGLFQVFELGLLGLKAHIIDSLGQIGGQCSELYPDKPIYDIPALPVCGAQELIDRLHEQIKPFNPVFHLDQEVTELSPLEDGRFLVSTARGTRFNCGAVIIAGGLGSFQPRRLSKPGIEKFENDSVNYKVKNPDYYKDKTVAILGGGDSALDWAIELDKFAKRVILVHRRDDFRAAPAMVSQMHEMVSQGQMDLVIGNIRGVREENDRLIGLTVRDNEDNDIAVDADEILAFYGLTPKLGPIANWQLDIERNQLKVDTEKFQTNVPGIFAVGDINTYPGKKKLILSGFHEAALAAFGVQKHLNPDAKQFLQYTTTSPLMHERLGVD